MSAVNAAAFIRQLRQQPTLLFALLLFMALVLMAVIGPWITPHAPDYIDFKSDWGTPPSWSGAHWFGTDSLGRDILARTLAGGRMSLLVGLAATLVSVLIGVSYGAVAGYYGGTLDQWMMRAVDVLFALPFMFIVILLTVAFGSHLVLVFAAIGAVNWLDMARIVRGQTLSLRQRSFVLSAELAGVPPQQIIRRHLVPNLLGVVAAYAMLAVPQAILVESFLSFLGLGVQEPAATLGILVNDGARDMEITPWSLAFPAAYLALLLLSLHAIGDGLRARMDDHRP